MPRILLIEDEELIRTMVALNLRRQGFEVDAFDRAEAMVDKAANGGYDLILLDIMLPGISGPEGLKRLRRQGVTTPVIMLTAVKDVSTKIDVLNLGADDYLAKPFDLGELTARVRALLRRSQAVAAPDTKEGQP